MNPASVPPSGQPFLASDVMGFALFVIALTYVVAWRRDREPGMGWFSVSLALIGVWMAATPYHLSPGEFQLWSPWYFVLFPGLVCLSIGLVDYLAVPPPLRRRALWATLLPATLYVALFLYIGLFDARIPRSLVNLPVGVWFLSLGAVAWWASHHEPGAGHRYVALALWAIPLLTIVLALGRVNLLALRYLAFAPILILALTLLTVSLMRGRRSLEAEVRRRTLAEDGLKAMNASLEELVAQRTADLQHMIAGLESFNRSVSHDLRGSLGGMAGAAQLAFDALERGDDSLARRALPLIASQADNSTRLVAALLSLAHVGDATLKREVVDLRRLVNGVVDQFAIERGARALPAIEVNEMPMVNADPELLKPVFANLIGNAIKYTGEVDAGRIEIGASNTSEGVTVSVRDNGVGFDPAAAARLFTPFVRLHGQRFEGHGIGLSIVRRAVERHGGRVWAEGLPGQGAVFRFSLPA